MAKVLGRPRKTAIPAPPSVLVPVDLLQEALKEVAETPVDTMTAQRFCDTSVKLLDAVFANERPKAEVVRKLALILSAKAWEGTPEELATIVDVAFAAYEARQCAEDTDPAAPSHSTRVLGRAVRRTAKTETGDAPATMGQIVDHVASEGQLQTDVDDDGYESYGNAAHEVLRDAKAAQPNPAVHTPLAMRPEQAKSGVTAAASAKSGTASTPPNNGPLRDRISRPAEDMRDHQPTQTGTAPTVPARSTPGMLDLRLGESDPDVDRAGLPISRPPQTPMPPSAQVPGLADGRERRSEDVKGLQPGS